MRKIDKLKPLIKEWLRQVDSFFSRHSDKISVGVISVGLSAIGVHIFDKNQEKKEVERAYKEGFEAASVLYAEKFQKQTDEFLVEKKNLEYNLEEYKALVDAYDEEIESLQCKLNQSETEKEYLLILFSQKNKLENLKKV